MDLDNSLDVIDNEVNITPYEKLNERQKRFIEEYLIDLNGTQAAIRAGYSPDTAKEQGSRLLSNANVRAYIDIALAERSKRVGVNADVVVRELARIALANPAKVVADDGSIIADASDDDLAAIQSIKVKTTTSKAGVTVEREVRFNDKNKSLELLGKHLGMFVDKKEIQVTAGQLDVSKMSDDEIKQELERQNKIAEQTIDIDL